MISCKLWRRRLGEGAWHGISQYKVRLRISTLSLLIVTLIAAVIETLAWFVVELKICHHVLLT